MIIILLSILLFNDVVQLFLGKQNDARYLQVLFHHLDDDDGDEKAVLAWDQEEASGFYRWSSSRERRRR